MSEKKYFKGPCSGKQPHFKGTWWPTAAVAEAGTLLQSRGCCSPNDCESTMNTNLSEEFEIIISIHQSLHGSFMESGHFPEAQFLSPH